MDLRSCIEKMEQEKTGNILKHKFSTDNGGYSHTSGSTSKNLDTRSDNFYISGEKIVHLTTMELLNAIPYREMKNLLFLLK